MNRCHRQQWRRILTSTIAPYSTNHCSFYLFIACYYFSCGGWIYELCFDLLPAITFTTTVSLSRISWTVKYFLIFQRSSAYIVSSWYMIAVTYIGMWSQQILRWVTLWIPKDVDTSISSTLALQGDIRELYSFSPSNHSKHSLNNWNILRKQIENGVTPGWTVGGITALRGNNYRKLAHISVAVQALSKPTMIHSNIWCPNVTFSIC